MSESFDRLATGVPGLDPILEGGLLKGGAYIVQGSPGAGKTILGNQIAFNHAAAGGNAVYVTLLAESHSRMIAHLRRMAFFRPESIPERIYYMSAFKVLEADGLPGLLKTIRHAIAARSASVLVVDGLVSAQEVATSEQEFKKFIHELQTVTGLTGCTTLLLTNTFRAKGNYPEHTMVDGVLELTDELRGLKTQRHLQVRKLRGSRHVPGKHTLDISDAGIRVHPRLETQLLIDRTVPPVLAQANERLGFGIRELDAMLHGGLPRHSITMVLGASGSGKTTLGLQFLAEGARLGEPGLCFNFFEKPRALVAKADRIGLGFGASVQRGDIEIMWHAPVEAVIDTLGERLLEAIHRRKVRRLCIDSLQGFQSSGEPPERISDVFHAISDELETHGVTTVYTIETRDLFGANIVVPVTGISAITHNLIVLRHVELRSQLYRLISILKVRDSDYDSRIREFVISARGVEVADTFASAEQILSGTARARMEEPLPAVAGPAGVPLFPTGSDSGE